MSGKVTIIMPVYNVEDYIQRSINSVLSQTYTNFELIIVDDGSTDGSTEVARKLADTDVRIKLVSKENGGLSDARNYGIDQINGEMVIFIDSDDHWSPDLLSETVRHMDVHSLDIVVFGFVNDYYDHSGALLRSEECLGNEAIFDGVSQASVQNTSLLGYAWNKLYRAELITKKNLKFVKGVSYIEDSLFNEIAFKEAERVGILNRSLYHYAHRHNETLGVKYFTNMANLDAKANGAFRSMLDSLGVKKSDINKLASLNLYNRVRWSLGVVARTDKVNRSTKIREILDLTGLIGDSFNWSYIANGFVDRLYRRLIVNNDAAAIIFIENIKAKKIKRLILDGMTNSLKGKLTYWLSKNDAYPELKTSTKKIVIALAADYGNLGDVAITYAQANFLKKEFAGYEVVKLPISRTYKDAKSLSRKVNRDDIITIVGGGNMGDMYKDIEEHRRFIIGLFRRNRIISFPQTIDFSDSEIGARELSRTKRAYNKHKRLTLIARESRSFSEMKQFFSADVLLAPDIVLSLDESMAGQDKRKNVVVTCIRSDGESNLAEGHQELMEDYIRDVLKMAVVRTDTHIGDVLLDDERAHDELQKIWSKFRLSKMVITDRLHGMIFCAITNTPCIAINNSNGKVAGVYKLWLSSARNIVLVEDFSIASIDRARLLLGKQKSPVVNDFSDLKRAVGKI